MATLKYEIWETEPVANRRNIKNDYWINKTVERFNEFPYVSKNTSKKFAHMENNFSDNDTAFYKYNMIYVDKMTFKPKSVVWYKDVFEHLGKIEPRMENAFLFNKRLK